jgi:hypothetical protein
MEISRVSLQAIILFRKDAVRYGSIIGQLLVVRNLKFLAARLLVVRETP